MAEESKLADKLEEKEKEVRFTEDELSKLKEIQQKYINVQQSLGQLSISKLRLEQQLNYLDENENNLKNEFINNQKDEKEFVDGMTKKYGDGTLDPESGKFISNKSV